MCETEFDLEEKGEDSYRQRENGCFNGTFDGQGHTVYNLKSYGKQRRSGLFGFTPNNPSIGNFIVEGANISGCEYAGMAVASAYLTILHDTTVKTLL